MANSIALAKAYVPLLDEVYKTTTLTGDLETDGELVRAGANAREVLVPKISMDGLADYSRNSGYVAGDVTLEWETVQYNYERGRMFSVDVMDDEETQNAAFGRLAGEFLRTKVVPELDAFRFATIASKSGIGTTTGAALSAGADVLAAIRAGVNAQDEAEVPVDGRILYITPSLLGKVKDLDTTKSREVLDGFAKIVQVPQSRFYTGITLRDGTTDGQTAGGYAKGSEAKNINFLIIHPSAIIQTTKHAVPKVITPEANQDADAFKYGYRIYGLVGVYDNKTAGVYLHKSNS